MCWMLTFPFACKILKVQKVRIILFLELWKPTKKKEETRLRLQFKYELLTPSSLRERSKTRFLVFLLFKKCIHWYSNTKTPKTWNPLYLQDHLDLMNARPHYQNRTALSKRYQVNFSGFGPNPLSLRDTAVFRYLSTIIEVANNVLEILFLFVLED